MRKFILIAAVAAVAMPSAAIAQNQDTRHDRREVRHDRREVRQDRREIRRDRGDRHEVRQDRRELRRDRREMRQDRREVRRDVRHHRRVSYVAPYRGWTYRPVTIGYRLRPTFYAPRYYISDYGAYDLRVPGRWQRWIRYGNDLLLVNVRSGRVLQVIHYRYW
jgi:Ni/Co efflux regulator RcnB